MRRELVRQGLAVFGGRPHDERAGQDGGNLFGPAAGVLGKVVDRATGPAEKGATRPQGLIARKAAVAVTFRVLDANTGRLRASSK